MLSVITWNCQNIAMLSIYQYQYQEKSHVIHGEMNTRSHFKQHIMCAATNFSKLSGVHNIIQPSVINYIEFINIKNGNFM